MSINRSQTRMVRVYALDLAIGDVIVDSSGDYIGTVDSVPDLAAGMVTFHLFNERTWVKTWRGNRVVHIEIVRRTS